MYFKLYNYSRSVHFLLHVCAGINIEYFSIAFTCSGTKITLDPIHSNTLKGTIITIYLFNYVEANIYVPWLVYKRYINGRYIRFSKRLGTLLNFFGNIDIILSSNKVHYS